MVDYSDAQKAISRARARLITTQPFYATLAMKMGATEVPEIPTMATDGKSLFYNADFVDGLEEPELVGVLAHEAMHVANLHHTRRNGRDPRQWNIACDYAINGILLAEGFTLPEGGLFRADLAKMSAEAIFAQLTEESDENGQGSGDGTSKGDGFPQGPAGDGFGDVVDPVDPDDAAAMSQAEADAKTATMQAAQVAKKAGRLPAHAKQLVEQMYKPTVTWQEVLRRFVDEMSRKDYSWSRPNRRFIGQGLYLPGAVPDGIAKLAVIIDTSGSISQDLFGQFMAELQEAVDTVCPDEVQIVHCDAEVKFNDTFTCGETLPTTVCGGGGTDMGPAFDAIDPNVTACVCFTDLYLWQWPEAPAFPTLWAVWGDNENEPPFGERVNCA